MIGLVTLYYKKILQACIEVLFPEFCIGCESLNTLLCRNCYETIEFLQFALSSKEKCPNLSSITCCCYYDGLAKKIIQELKYHSVIAAGKTVAHLMYYTCYLPEHCVVTFVPMHKKKIGKRGFNQTEVIATELSKLTNKPVAQLLVKTQTTKSQMSIHSKDIRKQNIIGTISINPQVSTHATKTYTSVLIIDDVFTSGATLEYCAKILTDFGFTTVHGLCFAHQS